MHWYWYALGAAALLALSNVALAARAIATGRLPRWLRSRTLRPDLWGYGALCHTMSFLAVVASWRFGADGFLYGVFAAMVLGILGSVFDHYAGRPRRKAA